MQQERASSFPAGSFFAILLPVGEMDDFIHSCDAAATYPKNLISHGEYQHTLQNYVDRLDSRERQLLGSEASASLEFWDLDDEAASNCSALRLTRWRLIAVDRLQVCSNQAARIRDSSPLSAFNSSNRSPMPVHVSLKTIQCCSNKRVPNCL